MSASAKAANSRTSRSGRTYRTCRYRPHLSHLPLPAAPAALVIAVGGGRPLRKFQVRHQRQMASLLVSDLGGDLAHLHEAHGCGGMGSGEADRVRVHDADLAPEFFRAIDIVAGTDGV